MPITVSSPSVTGDAQAIMRMVLVLPAPFGPRKPNASPTCTSKSMALTAVKSPKRFVRPRAWTRTSSDGGMLRFYRRHSAAPK